MTTPPQSLLNLVQTLGMCVPEERHALLASHPRVVEVLGASEMLRSLADSLSTSHRFLLYALIVMGQHERLMQSARPGDIESLLGQIHEVEMFYAPLGGILGYQARMLHLLALKGQPLSRPQVGYLTPRGFDISKENEEVRSWILQGVVLMDQMAEIYPMGGAADRLRLYDETTGCPLPAASLPFLGKTLLHSLMEDLQSREYVHYRLLGRQVCTPLAIMTSHEKNNHHRIYDIFAEERWFGRPRESIHFLCQVSVPTVNREGLWCLQGPGQLLRKPGGHGVVWYLAEREGILDALIAQGRTKVLVRQVNNPLANTDYGLLAFTGLGCIQDKRFGFASCPRLPRAQEGVNVLTTTPCDEGVRYTLTNLEYCDLDPGISYDAFCSNANLLFADLLSVKEAVHRHPFPGVLVNMKQVQFLNEKGEKQEEEVARLESTMQNLADVMGEVADQPVDERRLGTFLTRNHRRKTISAVKREFTLGSSLLETPEGCFLDMLHNVHDVLTTHCKVRVPPIADPVTFFEKGPTLIARYHPALGPLYSIIGQKWRGGTLDSGAEVQLEIAEIDFEEVRVRGSLRIEAEQIMGHMEGGRLMYSDRVGRCRLKNVEVHNCGINFDAPNVYWKHEITRTESCHIILRGMSEFVACDVTLRGSLSLEVPDGFRCTAREVGGVLQFDMEPIQAPSWRWAYLLRLEDNPLIFLKLQ